MLKKNDSKENPYGIQEGFKIKLTSPVWLKLNEAKLCLCNPILITSWCNGES